MFIDYYNIVNILVMIMYENNKYFEKILRILSFITSIYTLFLGIFYFNNSKFSIPITIILPIIFITSHIILQFTKYKIIPYLTLICFNASFIYCLSQFNVISLFIIPLLLLFYLPKKNLVYKILPLVILTFFVSRMLKSYLIINSISNNLYVFLGFFIKTLIEVTSIIFIFLLIYNLVNKTNIQSNLDNNTNINLLKFYRATTSHHNKYHQAHIKGVKEITIVLLDSLINDFGLKISKDFYNQIIFSSQFYDIGKVCIDPEILDKTDALTEEEKDLIKQHPQKGAELLSLLPKEIIKEEYLNTCRNVALQHHEKLDGSGYPNHLKQKEISLEARIITVADVADALLAWRPYKRPYSWEELLEIFRNEATGYDNLILQALYKNRRKIISISDENNQLLKEVLSLDSKDILRK